MNEPKPKKKPKVLFVTFEHVPGPTGTSCWASEELHALSGKLEVDAMSLKNEDLSHIERYFGARLLRVPVGQGDFLEQVRAFQRALSRQLDSEPYQVCHFTSIWEGMLLVNRKQKDKAKLIYEVHNLPSLDFHVTHPQDTQVVQTSVSLKQQEDRCFSLADLVLAGSEPIRNHLLARGVSAAKIHLMQPSLNTKPFEKVAQQAGQPGTILYLGSLLPWQGVENLLEAMASLPRQIRTRLMLISPTSEPWLSQVQERIQAYGLKRSVEFVEPVEFEKLPELLAKAQVCVAPTINHEHNRTAPGLPHKVLVYMAARRPILAAHHPALNELLRHGEHALLHPPGDIGALASNLQKLLLDRELATRLGNQAGLQLENRLALSSTIHPLMRIYKELVGDFILDEDPIRDKGLDTMPGIPASSQASVAGETMPIPMALIEAESQREARLEEPQTPAPAVATPTPHIHQTEEEIVFSSIEETPDHPQTNLDAWQVEKASQVRLKEKDSSETDSSKKQQSDTAPRFLLGGPPFKLSSKDEDSDHANDPTQSQGEVFTDEDSLALVDDKDVKLVEENEDPPDPSSSSSPGV
ncbi:MAG: glycosyltransferase family 4 protein [Deltaproteobacteria bacterium]|nr:glycosyltransferase family 4 protein [Deltaproteobacteria bacterium]